MKDRSNQKMLFLCLLTVMVLAVGLDQLFIRGQLREVYHLPARPGAHLFVVLPPSLAAGRWSAQGTPRLVRLGIETDVGTR